MKQITDVNTMMENVEPTFWKIGRLQTFQHWPFNPDEHQCTAENMAAAGFFSIGGKDEPDLVECFICGKQLDGWEPDDDPWQEHKKHQPECKFIKLDKQDEKSFTLKELLELFKNYLKHKRHVEYEKIVEEIKKEWQDTANEIPDIYEAMKKMQDT